MFTTQFFAAAAVFVQAAHSLSLQVPTSGGNSSGSLPVGLMFEDVNQAGEGGIHGQLLGDNAFQGTNASLMRYAPVGDVKLAIDSSNPMSAASVRSLKVNVPKGTSGEVGFTHDGYWGIKLPAGTYSTFFWTDGSYEGDFSVKLAGRKSMTEFGSTTIAAKKSDKWTKYEATFDVTAAPDGDNVYLLTFDGTKVAGSSISFTLTSLYPPTYLDKENGLKRELAEPLADVKGRFLRFPGGNNLEGDTIENRLRWNLTIGPLEDRPGRQGVWKYPNPEALGLLEYLEWAEYMSLEPLLDIFAGLALADPNGAIVGEALEPFIDDVLNQIEYVVGSTDTEYGKLRASHGREAPFTLTYVEIGNEDNLSNGCQSYPERFQRFYDAIHKAYPDLVLIASTADLNCLPSPPPKNAWLDYHRYDTPDAFVKAFNYFDNIRRDNQYIVNEFGVIFRNDGSRAMWPYMQASIAEAVYMIGMQRNSDLIEGFAYAPLIADLRANELYQNWNPFLIAVRNQPPVRVLTTSYYVNKMFSLASAPDDAYLDVKADAGFGPVYWVASKTGAGASILKLANYGDDEQNVAIDFGTAVSKGTLTTLSGDADAQNDEANPDAIKPVESSIEGKDGKFDLKLPPWSLVILQAST